uniref:Putative secreted protein n=1 Tax=Anopheles marajoara TaxID=58244 RepID=A0A2M4C814_9DIPT
MMLLLLLVLLMDWISLGARLTTTATAAATTINTIGCGRRENERSTILLAAYKRAALTRTRLITTVGTVVAIRSAATDRSFIEPTGRRIAIFPITIVRRLWLLLVLLHLTISG